MCMLAESGQVSSLDSFLACVFTVLESPVLVSLKFVSSQLFRDAG